MTDMSFSANSKTVTRGRVALLIDGENISAEHATQITNSASNLGDLLVKRVYGNIKNIGTWESVPGVRAIHSGTGKNSADMLLSIQAVEMAHKDKVDVFAIASSDADFTHLAHHLREHHFHVVGIGEAKTQPAFRKSCSQFLEIARSKSNTATKAPAKKLSDLDQKIHKVILQTEGKRIRIGLLSGRMHTTHKVRISQQPEKNWHAYLNARPDQYACDPRGPDATVRLVAG